MKAIYKRELSNFFTSPIGYVFVGILLFFEGFFFYNCLFYQNTEEFIYLYSSLQTFNMMLLPILTMRLLSEEKRQKTDQALLTAPVSLLSIVLGKFLAALTVYAGCIAATILHAFVMSFFGTLNWGIVFGNILGTILYGAAVIAIGLFIYGMTDNQIIAAVGGFAASLFLLLVDSLGSIFNSEFLSKIVTWISFSTRYSDFTNGIFNFANIIFFLSVCAVFIYLSVTTLEKRRWA